MVIWCCLLLMWINQFWITIIQKSNNTKQFSYLWRFCGHLDTSLQDRYGEIRVWTTAQPQPEVRVGPLLSGRGIRSALELLDKFVKLGHPGERQVTVGQEDPVPFAYALLDHACGNGGLALTEGERVEAGTHTPLFSQLEKGTGWVLGRK